MAQALGSLLEVAARLAGEHRNEDPGTKWVYLSEAPDEVRLVEVSASVGNSGEVLPFRFGPDPALGIPFPSVVVLLSEEEWEQVRAGQLHLPPGWAAPADLRPLP